MANCPALPTDNGKLILSTDQTAPGTYVVIGCTGFGRQKTTPFNVLCINGAWNPNPNTDCETGLDEREIVILAVSVSCAVLALVVILLLICSCFFFKRPKKQPRWWANYSNQNGYGENRKYFSYPRDTIVTRRETIRSDYGDFRPERPYGQSWRYSSGYGRARTYETFRPGKTEVYTREAFIPDYNIFEDGPITKRSESFSHRQLSQSRRRSMEYDRPQLEYMSRSRRYSAGSGAEMMRRSRHSQIIPEVEYISRSRRYSDGGGGEILRRSRFSEIVPEVEYISRSRRYSDGNAEILHRTQFSDSRLMGSVIQSPALIQYENTGIESVVEPVIEPIMEPVIQYVEKPIEVELVERQVEYIEKPLNYSTSFVEYRSTKPVVLDDKEVILKYDKFGTSITSLPKAKITELSDDESDMKEVPYKSSKESVRSFDPTTYFLGRQDYRPESWYA